MKRTFAKKALLFGVAAILTSVVPVQAMDEITAAVIEEKVTVQEKHHSGWSKKALQEKLTSSMKRLDKVFKRYMDCLKGKKKCSRFQKGAAAVAIVAILTTILGTLTWLGGKFEATYPYAKPFGAPEGKTAGGIEKYRGGIIARTEPYKKLKKKMQTIQPYPPYIK